MLTVIQGSNLALRFLLELCSLAALGYWGFHTDRGTMLKVVLGIGAPLLAAVSWGTFVAPRASVQLPGALREGLALTIFGIAAIALAAAGHPSLARAFALVAVINSVLMAVWKQ
jgi:hypothetical protein